MSGKNDGGAAFPGPLWHIDEKNGPVCDNPGMTLRDYFAGKGLQGICSDPASANMTGKAIAEAAYEYADAMLEAREK